MAYSRSVVAAVAVSTAVVLWLGAVRILAVCDQRYPAPTEAAETVYITSGRTVGTLVGPFKALAADLYWIRAVQYYGGTKRYLANEPALPAARPARDYHELNALLDIATTLDPQFNIAYRFGAIFLAESYPTGAGRADLAIRLLEKGLRARPDKWEYLHDIGFVNYWYRHDYKAAADAFERAAAIPGAPLWLKPLAATTLAEGGDRRSSRWLWETIRQSADVEWLRATAERRLAQLRALDEIDALQRLVNQYRAEHGALPDGWGPLARAQRWPAPPDDPAGVPYVLDPGGRVWMDPRSPLWPLPVEPQQLTAVPAARP